MMLPFFLLNFSDLDTAIKLRGHFRLKHYIKQGLLTSLKLNMMLCCVFLKSFCANIKGECNHEIMP